MLYSIAVYNVIVALAKVTKRLGMIGSGEIGKNVKGFTEFVFRDAIVLARLSEQRYGSPQDAAAGLH